MCTPSSVHTCGCSQPSRCCCTSVGCSTTTEAMVPSPAAGLVFGAAKLVDGLRGHEPGDRLDWLYGYEAK